MRFTGISGSLGLAGLVMVSGSLRASEAPDTNQTHTILATGGVISSILATPVVGEPFSAIQVHETTRTLADGTTVSHEGHHSIARDAEGRVHVEMRMAEGKNGEPDEVMVFVMDPVAHTLTTWVANAPNQMKTASFFKLPAQGLHPDGQSPLPAAHSEPSRPQPIVTVDDLGSQSIDGLQATGKRTTTIVPAGRSGNSAPITKVHEVWTSPDLQLVIKQRWSDPRSGERTVELEKIARGNPDPALFHAPAGYEVKSASETLKQLEEKLETAGQ